MGKYLGFAAALLGLTAPVAMAQPFGPARSEFRVNVFTTSTQTSPDAVFADDGSFVVVFQDLFVFFSDSSEILGQRYDSSGIPLGVNFRVNTYVTGTQTSARVARGSGAAGSFVVVWHDGERGQFGELYGQRFGANGTPLGPEFRVNVYTSAQQTRHSVASDGNGNFVVVWQSSMQDGSSYGVFGRRFSNAGVPLTGDFRVNTRTTRDQSYPSVSRESGGAFVVVWQSEYVAANIPSIFGKVFQANGAPLTGELEVDTSTGYEHERPSVTMDSLGFVVSWEQGPVDGGKDVFLRRFNAAGVGLAPPLRVNAVTTSAQVKSRVARSGTGGLLVVWQGADDGNFNVDAQRFDGAGSPLDGNFRVNSYSTGFQGSYSLAGGSSRFLVAWGGDSDYPLGTSAGVFARELCETLAGDADGSNVVSVSDVLYLINHLFAGGPVPIKGSDVDGSGSLDILDILYLINFLFADGPAPVCA